MKNYIKTFLIGFSMGTADLIPGVSGGTVAFLTGIYQTLIDSIKLISGDVLKLILKFKFSTALKKIPFSFLIPLGLGLLSAVFLLANFLSYLLKNHPMYIWSLFFGLVLASTYIVLKKISNWNYLLVALFLVSALLTYILVGSVPVSTPNTALYIFLSGVVAICAMILPGISGSFILVLLGKYAQVLEAVTTKDFVTLGIFILGCALGISIFSRVLSYVFKHYHNIAVAVLAGIMFGSIRKLWPFKITLLYSLDRHNNLIPLVEQNVFPMNFGAKEFFAVFLAFFGACLVLGFDYLQGKKTVKK